MTARDTAWYPALAPFVERDDLELELAQPFLTPTGDRVAFLPSVFLRLPKWAGERSAQDLGKKTPPMIDLDGQDLVAELAILRLLEREGWEGRWVITHGSKGEIWKYLTEWRDAPRQDQVNRPIRDDGARALIAAIADRSGNRFAGCWGVFAWRGTDYVFMEAKRQPAKDQDRVKPSQAAWVRAALSLPRTTLTPRSFALVQWDYQ